MKEKERAAAITDRLKKYYGEVAPELVYHNNYELAVSVVLSAQTTDRQVNGVTPLLFQKYPDFNSLSSAAVKDVEKIIRPTGFYHHKSKNIIQLAKKVTGEYSGELPSQRDLLMSLPGVGRKTANVILSQGFGVPAFAVDTHVGRISRRLGLSQSDDPAVVEKDVCGLIPENLWTESHLLFIRHGRQTCTARKPLCAGCPVNGLCFWKDKIL